MSGGVDSSVVAVLLHKIIGSQLTCIYIDNGLMRKNESEQVVSLFKKYYKISLVHVDASEIFLKKLSNATTEPIQVSINSGCLFCIIVSVTWNALIKSLSLRLDKPGITIIAYIKMNPPTKLQDKIEDLECLVEIIEEK